MALIDATLLELNREDDFELPEYACRGIVMTMQPIDAASVLRRDINGNLVDLSPVQMRKYKFTLSCDDGESPGFAAFDTIEDGVWPGDEFQLVCIPQLGASTQQTFEVMVSAPWNIETDEWGARVAWSLELEQR
jgi:hypothetical protein